MGGPKALARGFSEQAIVPIFFGSGFAALLYQVAWQRALFTIFGTGSESVTVVVTAFMLGLGLGGLLGGWAAGRVSSQLKMFAGLELGIGLFGLISLAVFGWVGQYTAKWNLLGVAVTSMLLLLIPTLLMGATLPMLVTHGVKRYPNVGRSVGLLYFTNTLGSAAACFVSAYYLLPDLGLSGAVRVAAFINITLALVVFVSSRKGAL